MAKLYRTETFGGAKVDVSTEKCVDSIEYCRELAKQRNAAVSGGREFSLLLIFIK